MLLHQISQEHFNQYFTTKAFIRGQQYCNDERVEDLQIDYTETPEAVTISADVKGSQFYEVDIFVIKDGKNIDIEGDCSCPVGYNCKHVVAALMEAIENVKANQTVAVIDPEEEKTERWLKSLENVFTQAALKSDIDATYELYFILDEQQFSKKLTCDIEPVLLRRLKSGKLGSQKRLSYGYSNHIKHLSPIENELLKKLRVVAQLGHSYHGGCHYQLSGSMGEQLLPELLATQKCVFKKNMDDIITKGPPTSLSLDWELKTTGHQKLLFKTDIQKPILFFVEGLWYIDPQHNIIGEVQTDLSQDVLKHFMIAPHIPATHVPKVNRLLQRQEHIAALPKLAVILSKEIQQCKPVPHLQLKMHSITWSIWADRRRKTETITLAVAILTFQYQKTEVSWIDETSIVNQTTGEELIKMARDFDSESGALKMIQDHGLQPIKTNVRWGQNNSELGHYFYFPSHNQLLFSEAVIPQLRQKGWKIDIDDDYAYQVVDMDSDDSEWFANIEEGETHDWFNLELGVTVDGQKVNLLPVIRDLLTGLTDVNDVESLTNKPIFAPLSDGHFVAIPGERVRHIVKVLIELFDHQSLNEDQLLRLSKNQAMRLLEIEKACGAAQLRWHGGDKLRQLGIKISEFKSITQAPIPTEFQGTLRPYQHDGLSWLQFLREYELGGVLADDMGLGKTIQTLTHIMLEKESGRMILPSLVIAPTSLMYNWEKEANQFAPNLRVAMIHGADRKKLFNYLDDYDLILTTYPLIVRDKELLLKQSFHLLILDEAQYIKNSKNLATQVAIQIIANHRLCLTGTPMENHLGELWSLYNFLMPGLLGDEVFFRRSFRTPIEKNGDIDRRQVLNRRIAPFLLRRTKDAVLKELPPKTEIIQYVELEGAQRDLYETIRIAMEEKVRKEVEKLGLSRSHIIILDALLKLRQVCCDPRLLKVDSPIKKEAKSAKMEWLFDTLPELVEEGRRILIFSVFTEMLGLIEQSLQHAKISYVKLTGRTKDRKTPIEQFQNGEVPVFLISLKAGGTGLNLTAADTVIHFDPWWNPAVENQATDRAYRIGQDKPVFVYKIVTKGTVEEKIIDMQSKKQALADSIYSDKSTGESKITEHDLKELFAPL